MDVKVLSLFSGMGAFEKALENKGIKYSIVNFCEKDSKIAKAFSLLHNIEIDKNLGDIKSVDVNNIEDFDLMTWGFPCVNFSKATRGEREGLNSKDSGLYFYGIDILKAKKPKYSIIENVPDLARDKKFVDHYNLILKDLKDAGYNSYVGILNAKDYGLPQRRERMFIVSIREDIDDGSFNFDFVKDWNVTKDELFDKIVEDKYLKVNPKIIESVKTRNLKDLDNCPTITKAIGRAGSSSEYISNCAFVYQSVGYIRRMTPSETMKFMGFSQEDYYILKDNGISDTTIFNMSGNSICVNVLELIFAKLFNK